MVINKQAFFVVKMAKNLEAKSAVERKAVMDELPPKAKVLVQQALTIFANNKRKSNGK